VGDNSNEPRVTWCPYSGVDIPIAAATKEHILSLAVGGHDDLTVMVDREANSTLGSKIDGELTRDFMIGRQRALQDLRGHSGREPVQRFKRVKDTATGRPLQVNWGKRLEVYDPIARKPRHDALEFQLTMKLDANIRLRFLAKCFLGAGYRVYGDLFRRAVAHHEPRVLMNREPSELTDAELASFGTRYWDWLSGEGLDEEQTEELQVQRQICEGFKGNVLVFRPGPSCLGFFGGVLGQYVGMVNVPADTSDFPKADRHDGGFAIVVVDGKLFSCSYRALLRRVALDLYPEMSEAILAAGAGESP
jgi:hypothetical protein